jgi:hypothetical protein
MPRPVAPATHARLPPAQACLCRSPFGIAGMGSKLRSECILRRSQPGGRPTSGNRCQVQLGKSTTLMGTNEKVLVPQTFPLRLRRSAADR